MLQSNQFNFLISGILLLITQLEFTQCKPTIANQDNNECPTFQSQCTLDGKKYSIQQYGTPPCWVNIESDVWRCYEPRETELKCKDPYFNIYEKCSFPLPKEPSTSTPSADKNKGYDNNTSNKPRPKCPSIKDFCMYSGIKISALGPYPKDSICWKLDSKGNYQCQPKEGFECKLDEIDVSKCFPKMTCPNKKEACIFNGNIYQVDTIGAPTCWKKTKLGWSCGFRKREDNSCSEDMIDIDLCYSEGLPSCPKEYYEICNINGTAILAGEANQLKCWSKQKDGDWNCRAVKNNGLCGRYEIDVTQCKNLEPPLPECPIEYNEECISSDDTKELAGEPNGFECWRRNALKKWECKTKDRKNNTCDKGYLDISNCSLNSKPTMKCPKSKDAICEDLDHKIHYLNSTRGHVCWFDKGIAGYGCVQKEKNGLCEPGLLDIKTCKFSEDEQTMKCPSNYEAICKTSKSEYKMYGKITVNQCWKYDNKSNKWYCQPKINSNRCEKGYLDIQQCPKFDKSKLELDQCPSKFETYCKSKDGFFMAGDPKDQLCWSKDEAGDYLCEPMLDGKRKCAPGLTNILSCDLPEPTQPKCPSKSTAFCFSGERKILLSDVKINHCWGVSYDGQYFCQPKEEDGNCKLGLLDITKCDYNNTNQNMLKCPERSNTCLYQDKNYEIYGESTPRCWSYNPSAGGWICEPQFNPNIKECPKNTIDIQKCFPSLPKCPTHYGTKCKDIMAGKPKDLVCWYKDKNNNWDCYKKQRGEKYCNPGHLDITTCKLKLPPVPKCPKDYLTPSFNNGKLILAGEPGSMVCWRKEGNSWASSPRPNGYEACPPSHLDITTCNFIRPDPPNCPSDFVTLCKKGDRLIRAGRPGEDLCWQPTEEGWSCRPRGSSGQCSLLEIDVTQCKFEKPSKPICPSNFFTQCYASDKDEILIAGDHEGYNCWYYDGDQLKCSKPSKPDDSGKLSLCDKNQLDITQCSIQPPPLPECPPLEAICLRDNQTFTFKVSNSPPCWRPSNKAHTCTSTLESGTCPLGFINKSQCKYPPGICPSIGDVCKDKSGNKIKLNSKDSVPKCWNKTLFGWECHDGDETGDCYLGERNIQHCYI